VELNAQVQKDAKTIGDAIIAKTQTELDKLLAFK